MSSKEAVMEDVAALDAPRSRGLRRLAAGGLGVVVLLGLGIAGKLGHRAALAETVSDQALPPVVNVVKPHRPKAAPAIVLPATVEPMQETTVYARTSGYLKVVRADIGDRVTAGQLLAEIESPEVDESLREARARLEEEGANRRLAEATLARTRQLHQDQLVSTQQLDEQEAAFRARQASVDAIEATVQRLSSQQGWTRVVAPFSGTVTSRSVDLGALITAGSGTTVASLFTIAQTDSLRVFVDVPQTAAADVRVGQTVEVSLRERPGAPIQGRVARTAGALDPRSRTLRTEVHLPNPDRALLPGMYVQVTLPSTSEVPLIVVPANTVVIRVEGPQVALVEGASIHYRKVGLGRDFGRELEISSGLTGDESLVVNPADRLTEGQAVQIAAAGDGGR